MLRKLITDCLTEKDNQTFDVVRVLGAMSFFMLNGIAIFHVVTSCHDFNFIEVASGISMLLGTIGAGVTLKYTRETNTTMNNFNQNQTQ